MTLVFYMSAAGRFAVSLEGGRVLFETRHLAAEERAELRRVLELLVEQARQEGYEQGHHDRSVEAFQ